ncbi:MAG: response regulator transcription factor [Oscillospiraceae bacterium]|nr:response regulator transcription factor [Oscillospiraceae bacterium]
MYNILICDDEQDIVNALKIYLSDPNYCFYEASNGKAALDLLASTDIHLVLMDIMMPVMDGYTACREIRKIRDIPMLMLSAKGTEGDKLYGFEMGVDDYVVKPFSPRELMARLKVIVARHAAPQAAPTDECIHVGDLVINKAGRTVKACEQAIDLTTKEFDLLLYLAENRNIVLSREKILNAVWGYEYLGEDRTVDWQIKLLRSKLGESRDRIKTLRGVGYKLEG